MREASEQQMRWSILVKMQFSPWDNTSGVEKRKLWLKEDLKGQGKEPLSKGQST